MVRRAVRADEPRPVEREDHRQVLERDVVNDLVEGPLEEGRVDRRDRPRAVAGEPGGEADAVRLGDPDVEEAVGMLLLERVQPGPARHRGGDRDHPGKAAAASSIASPNTAV